MGWLDKLLGREEGSSNASGSSTPKASATSSLKPWAGIEGDRFGRYSDNNKSYTRTQSWYKAEDRYKEKAYNEALAAFFDYLGDDEEGSVKFRPDGRAFTFELTQGSKHIYGSSDGERIVAKAQLANMEKPSAPVMRQLLNLNYGLYYTRCALDEANNLCMIFDSDVKMASPNKMYYALKELATKADRQDDLLVADFTSLKPVDIEHIVKLSDAELEVKYTWFRKWIQDTLTRVGELNADSFSGSIAYLQLVLLYRIDFLITPEARLLATLERISAMYWEKKEEVALVERNAMMKEGIRKLLDITRDEFAASVYRSKGTFAVAAPGTADKIKENIVNANKDSQWYVDNKYPDLAQVLNEYGIVYNQWSFSMPKVMTDLSSIYIAVMHADYFKALGLQSPFYHPDTRTFEKELINRAVDAAIARWPDKYVDLKWDNSKIKWEGLYEFGTSFTDQMANLNLEVKR